MPKWITPRRAAAAAGLLIGVYFLYFARWSFRAEWTHDDLMNCQRAVFYPLHRLLGDLVLFFRPSDVYRPLPELVYRVFFALAGFNLLPIRAFLLAVMGANLFLAYGFARRLSGSREAGILTALLSSFHINLLGYYFNTGQIYDILCYLFYFLALLWYLRIRQSGRRLRWWEILGFCGLYAMALNSKELAVSLPLVLAVYELLSSAPALRLRAWLAWAKKELVPVWLAVLMTIFYIPGRVMTQGGVASTPGYRMEISLQTYLTRTGFYLNELFYSPDYFDARRTAAFALLLLLGAIWTRSRALATGWALYFGGILPLAFLGPRGLTAVWIPTAGLLLYGAGAVTGLRDALLARLRLSGWRPLTQVALFLLAGWFMIHSHTGIRPIYASWMPEYSSIRNLREALRRCSPEVPKGASMLFLTDPLNQTYSTVFVVQLLYRDPTSRIDQLFRLEQKPGPTALASYDYIFDFVNGKLVRLDPIDYARGEVRVICEAP